MNIEESGKVFYSSLINNKYKPYESSANREATSKFSFNGMDSIIGLHQGDSISNVKDMLYKFPQPDVPKVIIDNEKFIQLINSNGSNLKDEHVLNRKNYNNLNVHYQKDRLKDDKIINKYRNPNWIYRDGKNESFDTKTYSFKREKDENSYVMVEKVKIRKFEFKPVKNDFNILKKEEKAIMDGKKTEDQIETVRTKVYEKINN